jgi:diadenosine tetraphosphatase ApaH/serine/threonine PP2A family protein phosphatase
LIIALLSDIHGNLEALNACLRHARERGAERYAFLGDLVGYGADAQPVVETVMRYAAEGAVVVKGNHDEAVEHGARYMNEAAHSGIEWARRTLSPQAKAYLDSLPTCVREDSICYVHASASFPERWEYIDSPHAAERSIEASQSTYTFSGHVHVQELYFVREGSDIGAFKPVRGSAIPVNRSRRWLALVGSVGQPRDHNPAAAYALFDSTAARITFHRVAYDNLAAAEKIRRAGLPAALAYRVEKGI